MSDSQLRRIVARMPPAQRSAFVEDLRRQIYLAAVALASYTESGEWPELRLITLEKGLLGAIDSAITVGAVDEWERITFVKRAAIK